MWLTPVVYPPSHTAQSTMPCQACHPTPCRYDHDHRHARAEQGEERRGEERTGQDRTGQDRTGQERHSSSEQRPGDNDHKHTCRRRDGVSCWLENVTADSVVAAYTASHPPIERFD